MVVGGFSKYQPDDSPFKLPAPDFVGILEEVPPGRTEIRRIVGVDGGDEVKALMLLVGMGGDMGI